MVPGKLGLVETKVKVLVGRTLALGLFETRASVAEERPLPITSICAGTVTLMVEVKTVQAVAMTGNQRPA